MGDGVLTESCSGPGSECSCGACKALREAAAAGARPKGVPIRIYGGYLEARSALRANAPALANQSLEWLLAHLAEERGARPGQSLAGTLATLKEQGVISPQASQSLLSRAVSEVDANRRAWALLSVAEHIFYRLYL